MAWGASWAAQPSPLPAWPTLAAPNFRPAAREVDTWRREAAFALDLPPERALTLATGGDIAGLSRCVRLNNYWCIKRAGWSGEIAADAEGHVAFASAREGAAVAALLLRRYYVDFGLKSARAIISRWAPAQCGPVARLAPRLPRTAAATAPDALSRRGIGNTLRARWLAAHRPGGIARTGANRRTVARSVIARTVGPTGNPMGGTPVIMAGLGAPVRVPVRLAMLPYPGFAMGPAPGARTTMPLVLPPLTLPPVSTCTSDTARVAHYAAKTAEGVVAGADTDLALFDAAGRPTDNLARVMANMASVEIGPLKAGNPLILAGIAAISSRRP